MLKILSASEFAQKKREPLLDYRRYSDEATDLTMRVPRVGVRLLDAEWMSNKSSADAMSMTRVRSEYAADLLTLSYSAGLDIDELKSFYPNVLEYWEEFAKFAKAFDQSREYEGSEVAHFGLLGDDFDMVNRMVCFAIALGWKELLPRLASLLAYRNPHMDGMLERLLSPFVPGRPAAPDQCTRHLPYFKTLKIFGADAASRPGMMARYLDEWYHASRREPYYDSHKGGTSFRGYWSWEAAAITLLLEIDDSGYRDAAFYPSDLVDFARMNRSENPEAETKRAGDGELGAR